MISYIEQVDRSDAPTVNVFDPTRDVSGEGVSKGLLKSVGKGRSDVPHKASQHDNTSKKQKFPPPKNFWGKNHPENLGV